MTSPGDGPGTLCAMTDEVHDPGPDAAAATFDGPPDIAANPLAVNGGGTVRIGTASWTDPTMTAAGVFYPSGADSAEERLQFYASRFPLVEVDATYYSLPVRRTSELWVERTPPDFTFDIKAHALMTGQPTETKRLPKDLREALPGEIAEKARIYAKDLPDELRDDVWAWFADGLEPLAGGRPARLDPAPVPALVLHLVGEPRHDRGVGRAAAQGGHDPRGRVPQRIVVQREEHRADAQIPRRPADPAGHGRWAAGLQVERAGHRRGDLT